MFGLFKKKESTHSEPLLKPIKPVEAEDMKDDAVSDSEMPKEPELSDFVPPPSVGMMPGEPSGIPGFDYSPVDPSEEFKAVRGETLADGEDPASEDEVIEALRTVYDPEIPVNIYDLGLIYGLEIDARGDIKIDMTLTAPGCPVAGEMPGMVADAVDKLYGTGVIEVTLVWEPGWTPDNMSEDAKLALGMG